MRFADFITFDAAAAALFGDPNSRRNCRDCLCRLAETAQRHPGVFSEAMTRDARKGVAFKQRSLDDTEHGIFAQRLADRMWKKPDEPAKGKKAKNPSSTGTPAYGDFLRQSVQQQGEVLSGIKWEDWNVTKAVLELGGVDPAVLADPLTTPAEKFALVQKIKWQNVTLPALKAKLGSSLAVPDDWKREFGIERLKRIKTAVEQGQALTDPQEQKTLHIWRTLETQLRGEDGEQNQILPSGPQTDVATTRLPMSPEDRKRFYRALTGTHESVDSAQAHLHLSPQSAYDYLVRYGVEIVGDEEAKDLFLTRILNDLRSKEAFVPSSQQGSEADRKRWKDSVARSWGGFLPPARFFDPSTAPGVAQRLAGMTTRGFKTRLNPSGRRVPYAYGEPEEFNWSSGSEDTGIKYSIDVPSSEIPSEDINAFYRTPQAKDAFEREMLAPARDAVHWLRKQGWIDDQAKVDDLVQDVVVAMLNRTGAVPNWRSNVGFRRATASMLARRFASQGWPSQVKVKTGHMGDEDQPGVLQMATGSGRTGGEDEFSKVRGSAANARQVIQKAIASMLDADTETMGGDEGDFVDALESLNDPDKAIHALDVLDQLSTRYQRELPQVKRAVDRIQRHLELLVSKVRGE
jgi:hypothetical protein